MAGCLTMGWQADPKMYCSIYAGPETRRFPRNLPFRGRGLQNQALANARGTLCFWRHFRYDYHTKPGKIGLGTTATPPYLTCIFRKKPSTFTRVRIIQEKSVRALFLRTFRCRYFGRSGTGTRTNFSILYGRGFTYVLIFIIFLWSDVHQTFTDVLKNSYKFKNNKI